MTDRAAQAAAQSDPRRNWNFSRPWGSECAVGDPVAPMRSWHADSDPALFLSAPQRQAERVWRRLTRRGVQL